jgi:hypothetical protein
MRGATTAHERDFRKVRGGGGISGLKEVSERGGGGWEGGWEGGTDTEMGKTGTGGGGERERWRGEGERDGGG